MANGPGLKLTLNADNINGGVDPITNLPLDDILDGTQQVSGLGTLVNTLSNIDNVDLGLGNDTANIQLNNAAGIVQPASFKGIETLNFTSSGPGATLSLINGDAALKTVNFANAGNNSAQVFNLQAAPLNFGFSGSSTLSFATVAATALQGANDVANIAISNLSGNAVVAIVPTTGQNGYETVNLTSLGPTLNTVSLVTTGVSVINTDGATGLKLGNGSLAFTTLVDKGTGGITFDVGGALNAASNITTGSGNDYIRARTGADMINIAAGGNDTIIQSQQDSAVYNAAAGSKTFVGAFDIVTGATAGDRVAIANGGLLANYAANGQVNNTGTLTAAAAMGENTFQLIRGVVSNVGPNGTDSTFVAQANGPDTLLVYDANSLQGVGAQRLEAVALRGFTGNAGVLSGSQAPADLGAGLSTANFITLA